MDPSFRALSASPSGFSELQREGAQGGSHPSEAASDPATGGRPIAVLQGYRARVPGCDGGTAASHEGYDVRLYVLGGVCRRRRGRNHSGSHGYVARHGRRGDNHRVRHRRLGSEGVGRRLGEVGVVRQSPRRHTAARFAVCGALICAPCFVDLACETFGVGSRL